MVHPAIRKITVQMVSEEEIAIVEEDV